MTEKKPEKTENQNEETIVAYKGFDKDFKCRDFQYKAGKKYKHKGTIKVCESGFHACEHPLNVFEYYPPSKSRFAVVEQSGDLSRGISDTKVASRNIRIKFEIGIADLVKAAVEYVSSRCKPVHANPSASASGDWGAALATEDWGAALASGYLGAASATGNFGAASVTGNRGAALASGYRGAASTTGNFGAALASGYRGAASATGDFGAASATGDCGAASATGNGGAALTTGNWGAASTTGDGGAASATGDWSVASATGGCARAEAAGHCGAAVATGYQGEALATGRCGVAASTVQFGAASAKGPHSVALVSGADGRAKGENGCALFLVYREPNDGSILHAKALIVGKNGIKPDTWYRLNSNGEVERVD